MAEKTKASDQQPPADAPALPSDPAAPKTAAEARERERAAEPTVPAPAPLPTPGAVLGQLGRFAAALALTGVAAEERDRLVAMCAGAVEAEAAAVARRAGRERRR